MASFSPSDHHPNTKEYVSHLFDHSKLTNTYIDPSLGKRTFGEWWEQCQASTVNLRISTRERDALYGRLYLLPRFGTVTLGRIDHLMVKTWVADLSATGLAPATVVKAVQLLGRTLRSAVDAGLIPSNPPFRIHDLRHTAVALWIAAGASPKEVAGRAGHASVVTVLDRYGHLLPGTEDRVNDALDVLFNGVVAPSTASITNLIRDENASSRVQLA